MSQWLLAWLGCCLGSAACAVLWWPLGLIPAVIVVALATKLLWRRITHRGRGKGPTDA